MTSSRHLLLLLPALLLLAGCGRQATTADTADAPAALLTVRTHSATNRLFERRLTVQGTLEAKRFASVSARVGGNLDALWVEEGDTVVAGETRLFQIDPVALSNAVTIASQELNVAAASLLVAEANATKIKAEADKVERDHDRYQRLYKEQKVTANEYETMATALEQAKAGLAVAAAQITLATRQHEQAEASLAIARKNLSDSLVVAPLSGIVSQRRAEPGEFMSAGTAVVTIVDPTLIEAAAFIPARYYHDVVPGTSSFRLQLADGSSLVCEVAYRSPVINPSLRTFEIKGYLRDFPAGQAVPGSMVALTLIFETREGVGTPTEAILQRNGGDALFVIRDGKAHLTPVTTGLQNDTCTEILSGLQSGDQVVVEGQTFLGDLSAVTVLK